MRKVSVSPWTVFIILIAFIIAFVAVPAIRRYNPNAETGSKIPQTAGAFYIDISHYNNGGIIWDSLKVMTDLKGRTTRNIDNALNILPVSGVIIKATEGESMKDELFSTNWKECSRRNFKRGAYHFYRSSKDPAAQARNFISTVGELRFKDMPPILDIETIHKGCTRKELNDGIRSWLDIVSKHYGKTPIVYTYDSFAKDYLDPDILSDYPIWIARYSRTTPSIHDWDMWQFTDKAVVYGIPGRVDLSVCKSSAPWIGK